jgi:hypothetical protein
VAYLVFPEEVDQVEINAVIDIMGTAPGIIFTSFENQIWSVDPIFGPKKSQMKFSSALGAECCPGNPDPPSYCKVTEESSITKPEESSSSLTEAKKSSDEVKIRLSDDDASSERVTEAATHRESIGSSDVRSREREDSEQLPLQIRHRQTSKNEGSPRDSPEKIGDIVSSGIEEEESDVDFDDQNGHSPRSAVGDVSPRDAVHREVRKSKSPRDSDESPNVKESENDEYISMDEDRGDDADTEEANSEHRHRGITPRDASEDSSARGASYEASHNASVAHNVSAVGISPRQETNGSDLPEVGAGSLSGLHEGGDPWTATANLSNGSLPAPNNTALHNTTSNLTGSFRNIFSEDLQDLIRGTDIIPAPILGEILTPINQLVNNQSLPNFMLPSTFNIQVEAFDDFPGNVADGKLKTHTRISTSLVASAVALSVLMLIAAIAGVRCLRKRRRSVIIDTSARAANYLADSGAARGAQKATEAVLRGAMPTSTRITIASPTAGVPHGSSKDAHDGVVLSIGRRGERMNSTTRAVGTGVFAASLQQSPVLSDEDIHLHLPQLSSHPHDILSRVRRLLRNARHIQIAPFRS